MTQERTTEGVPPTRSMYSRSTGYPTRAVSRWRRPSSSPSRLMRKPQWRPETAMMCMSPASSRSLTVSSSSPSRSPVRRAEMKPAAGWSKRAAIWPSSRAARRWGRYRRELARPRETVSGPWLYSRAKTPLAV